MSLNLLGVSLRNSKRILALSVGAILAVSLITGINVGIETASGSVLNNYVDRLPYDLTAVQSSNYKAYQNISQALYLPEQVSRVETVFHWTPIQLYNITAANFTLASSHAALTAKNASVNLLGLSDNFQGKYSVTFTDGTWNLQDGVVVSNETGQILGIHTGDQINLTLYYTIPGNSSIKAVPPPPRTIISFTLPLKVTGLANLSPTATSMVNYGDGVPGLGANTILKGPPYAHELILSYGSFLSGYNLFANTGAAVLPALKVLHRIFLRRDKLTNLFDPAAMVNSIQTVEGILRFQTSSYHITFQDHLASSVAEYQNWLSVNLVTFYLFSLPVLAVSWYVTMTAWFLTSGRRRRDLGLLKVRGTSAKDIFRATILEAAVIGILGSTLGILSGYLTGSILASTLNGGSALRLNIQAVTPETVVLGLIVGMLISTLGSIQPALTVAGLQPIEAGREYLASEMDSAHSWRPRWTWVALVLSVYKMAEWLIGFSPATLFPSGSPSNSFFISTLYFAWAFLSGTLTFLAPFLFVFAVTRILMRSRLGLYRSAYLVLKSSLNELADVTARALSRNPARVTRTGFLIALTLSFGIFTMITTATSNDLQARVVRLSVGSDINVKTVAAVNSTLLTQNGDINYVEARLGAISGVAGISTIVEGSATYSGSQTVAVYGIESSSLLKVAYESENFAVGDSASALQQMRNTPNGTLVSEVLSENLHLNKGDLLQLNQTNTSSAQPITLHITGLFKFLPGIDSPLASTSQIPRLVSPTAGSVVMDIAQLRSINFTNILGYTFLLRTQAGVDAKSIATSFQSLVPTVPLLIVTLPDALQSLNSDSSVTAPVTFLQLTSAYLFVTAVVGSTLTSWTSTLARQREIAIYRVRGASRRQSLKFLFAEPFAILAVAIIISIPAGLMEAYSVLRFVTSPSSPTLFANLSFEMLLPAEMGVVLIAATLCFLLSSLIPAWLSMRRTIIQTLRFR